MMLNKEINFFFLAIFFVARIIFITSFLLKAELDDTTNDLSYTIEVHNEYKQSNVFRLNLRANASPKFVKKFKDYAGSKLF